MSSVMTLLPTLSPHIMHVQDVEEAELGLLLAMRKNPRALHTFSQIRSLCSAPRDVAQCLSPVPRSDSDGRRDSPVPLPAPSSPSSFPQSFSFYPSSPVGQTEHLRYSPSPYACADLTPLHLLSEAVISKEQGEKMEGKRSLRAAIQTRAKQQSPQKVIVRKSRKSKRIATSSKKAKAIEKVQELIKKEKLRRITLEMQLKKLNNEREMLMGPPCPFEPAATSPELARPTSPAANTGCILPSISSVPSLSPFIKRKPLSPLPPLTHLRNKKRKLEEEYEMHKRPSAATTSTTKINGKSRSGAFASKENEPNDFVFFVQEAHLAKGRA